MCSKNINQLLNINFSLISDEFNWLNNTNTPIETIDGQLVLTPESSTSQFARSFGDLDPTNNRIKLQMNLEVFRTQTSTNETFRAKIQVFNGSTLIDGFDLYLEDLQQGQKTEYNFDRVYKYEDNSGAISMKITIVEGWENVLLLDYIKSFDFNYCDDDVRSYFLVDQLFENSFDSVSSAIELKEWKVDDVETLTPAFFSENNSPGGNPLLNWLFASANIDGSGRVSDIVNQNTFNPFVSEWGLTFDPLSNYYDGKPTAVTSGSNYGSGIMQIGFEKPSILNGQLIGQDGAFFVDMDFTKNLKVVFNVLINNTNSNVFDSPDIYRKYTLIWNASNCSGQFYYNDVLNNDLFVDQYTNGFLSGLTGVESTLEIIGCDESFSFNGQGGTFSFVVNFGTEIGQCGIDYNAYGVPDKFEIEWNGNVYSSGYVGSNGSDQALLNLGISPSEINTGSPGTGIGNLLFNKATPTPSTAVIRVTAPFAGTAWSLNGICPDGGTPNEPPSVEISSTINTVNQGVSKLFNIDATDSDGTIVSYFIEWGDGGSTNGVGAPPSTTNHTFNTLGSKTVKITVTDDNGLTASDTYVVNIVGTTGWSATGTVNNTCLNSATGTVFVTGGVLPVYNRFVLNSGTVVSKDAVFTDTVTEDVVNISGGEFETLDPGTYTWEIESTDCSSGTGFNQIFFNQITFP